MGTVTVLAPKEKPWRIVLKLKDGTERRLLGFDEAEALGVVKAMEAISGMELADIETITFEVER